MSITKNFWPFFLGPEGRSGGRYSISSFSGWTVIERMNLERNWCFWGGSASSRKEASEFLRSIYSSLVSAYCLGSGISRNRSSVSKISVWFFSSSAFISWSLSDTKSRLSLPVSMPSK